jgi:cell division protein FtsA
MAGEIIVGLDIGTTKICAVVGELQPDGIEIVGIGSHPSEGLRKGVVINIERTVNSIKEAIEEAETMAGCEISSVYAGVAGGHVKGFNSHGVIALKEKEVTKHDVDRVIEAASAVAIPMDREVMHILTQEFIVDEQDGITDPVGMSGVRLEAKIHIVTGAVTSAQNIIKCANRAGLDVCDIVLESLASSEAVNLTYDIAIGLRTPRLEAEKIKIKYGCGISSMIGKDETIEVPGVGGRKPRILSRQILGEILEPRVEEIFSLIYGELLRSGYENLITSGVVITGGSAELPGVPEMAEQIFNAPSR